MNLCVIFGSVCLGFVSSPLLCRSVSLSPTEIYVYFISPGCLFVLRCATPPLAVFVLLISGGSHRSSSPPLLCCSLLADSHPLLLPLLSMVSLSPSWRLIPLSSFSCTVEQSRAHPNRLGLSGKLIPSLPLSLSLSLWFYLSVCFATLSLLGNGYFSTQHCVPFSYYLFDSRNVSSVTAAKNGSTSDRLHQLIIPLFAPSCLLWLLIELLWQHGITGHLHFRADHNRIWISR